MASQKLRRKTKTERRSRNTARKLSAGEWFEKLVAVQERLRAPNGCPWDREQTHETLRTYLVEEAYEVLDALQSGDDSKFKEEMGDLLLQIVFHSEIARGEGRFTAADVIHEIHDKMVRRHPHVFGEKRAKDSAEVLKNWERIKAAERGVERAKSAAKRQPSLLDGVPRSLPAALEGYQLTRKAAKIGFDWGSSEGVFLKLKEETAELHRALDSKNSAAVEEELGDLLFAAVNLARFLGVDPEIALKNANAKFARRFRAMERLAGEQGGKLATVSRDEMERLWESAKQRENDALKAADREALRQK